MTEFSIRRPDDFHVHLRQGPALASYAARSARHFARILVMPNVTPPIISAASLIDYRTAVENAIESAGGQCGALMSFKLIPGMGAEAVLACAKAGAVAGKYYPVGATTNSSDGVPKPEAIREELLAMEAAGLILSIHGEEPSAPALGREEAFLPVLERLAATYPKLKIVFEHLSTARAVEKILSLPDRIAGTITAHHLAFTIDDLLGDKLDSAYFCKPVLKHESDRLALLEAAAGSPRFFFGSDSAPHPRGAKENGLAAAGSYSAPAALALLAQVFDQAGLLSRLERFCSESGALFYGLPLNTGTARFHRESWTVPGEIDGVVPLAAGRILGWQAESFPT